MVSACLKIIACGSDAANKDDELERTESKGSTDKCGWCFRKKSTGNRGLSNTVIPDTQATENKEYAEPTTFDFPAQSKPAAPEKISLLWPEMPSLSTEVSKPTVPEKISESKLADEVIPLSTEASKPAVPEKISVLQLPDEVTPLSTDEVSKPAAVLEKVSVLQLSDEELSTDEDTPLSTEVNSNTPDPLIAMENVDKISPIVSDENSSTIDSPTTLVNFIKVDLNPEEPVAIVLQSAIRGYLAKRSFLKLRNVVKLQAAVRGLLVRRQAVGTLLCVQAIVKMQALVRSRRAQSLEGSVTKEQLDEQQEKSNERPLIKINPETKAKTNYSSTQTLLRNGFARQLLESTPKKKQIRIKCDPSKPDSSWKWFDRWTTVSSSKFTLPQKPEFSSGDEEQGERIDSTASEVGAEIPAEVTYESEDLSNIVETTLPIDVEENLSTYYAGSFDFQVSHPTLIRRDDTEQPQLEDDGLSKEHGTSSKIEKNQTEVQLDAASPTMDDSISREPESDGDQLEPSVKCVASEQLETEDKKMFESRKASNPAFIAAKSKFEDLSLRTISGRSLNQDSGLEMKLDIPSFPATAVEGTKEHSLTENSISCDPRVYGWGSECGTELSISSTLDSPDRYEIRVGDFDNETKVAEKIDGNLNEDTYTASDLGNLDEDETDVISQPISPYPDPCVPGKIEDGNSESVDSVIAVETPSEDQKPERTASDVQTQVDATNDHEACRSSVDGSPGNNITSPELHGSPSSKVSVKKHKKKKLDKNGSPQTRKSQSVGKKSPLSPNPDSGARSSTEQLQKDSKIGKKRSSFGSARLDHVELEPRDSSSSTLPSYMQATESARAKAHVNNSPRSKSDIQDKDIYIKKRHSLPANGKQGSPRVQQLTSERQHGANGNHTRTPW